MRNQRRSMNDDTPSTGKPCTKRTDEAALIAKSSVSLSTVRRGRRLLSMNAVVHRTSLSRATIYRLASSGEFPPRVRLLGARSAWIEDEVEAWIEERIASRDGCQGSNDGR